MDAPKLPHYVEGFDPEVNLRDLGGWPTADGRTVRRGLLYRSSRLDVLDTSELVSFQRLGLSTVVDLRPDEEAARHRDPRFPAIRYVHADAGRDTLSEEKLKDASPEEVIGALAHNSARMAFGNNGIKMVLSLMEREEVPLLFHCNSGRDRSGVVAMVILMALGCSDDVLIEDYLLTNAYRVATIAQLEEAYADALKLGEEYRQLVRVMAGVLEQVGQSVLDAVDAAYPTRAAYLQEEYGLDVERLARLRTRYLA